MKIKSVEDLKKNPEADRIVEYIIDRWKRGLYSLVLIAGLPGTGKSSVCIRLKEKIHAKLGGEAQIHEITDNLLDFVRFVRTADPTKKTPDIGVCEEVSVLFPSRRAMSGDNVDLARILDTCRKKKVILFANAPLWPSIDSHMRSMANVYIQTVKVYKSAELVYCKCYKLQTDPRTGKTYTHSFKRGMKDVNRCYVLKPTLKLWDEYELKKDKFLDTIYERIENRQMKKLEKEAKSSKTLKQIQEEELKKDFWIYEQMVVKKRTQKSVYSELGIPKSTFKDRWDKIKSLSKASEDKEELTDEKL
jgi:hypothetical protein